MKDLNVRSETIQLLEENKAVPSLTDICLRNALLDMSPQAKETKTKINKWMTANIGLLLLLSHFSCVRLCVTPQMAAHQAPPSLGFSRQEHWNGLPFPSPMHESEK